MSRGKRKHSLHLKPLTQLPLDWSWPMAPVVITVTPSLTLDRMVGTTECVKDRNSFWKH